jgi:hypothetical protein
VRTVRTVTTVRQPLTRPLTLSAHLRQACVACIAVPMRPTCRVCEAAADLVLRFDVLASYEAGLCKCSSCGFVFVPEPRWLEGSFSSHLNRLDVGSVDRTLLVSQFVRGLMGASPHRRGWTLLDFGGGDGLLTRLLRDVGVDCRWEDPYCEPVFAVGPPHGEIEHFDLVVMSEVALHLTDPVATFADLVGRADRVLFTATVPPDPIPADWWYLMPSTGQHVAFYPTGAVAGLADRLGVHWCSDGKFFHLLSRAPIERSTRLLMRHAAVPLLLAQAWAILDLYRRARGTRVSLMVSDQDRLATDLASTTEGTAHD